MKRPIPILLLFLVITQISCTSQTPRTILITADEWEPMQVLKAFLEKSGNYQIDIKSHQELDTISANYAAVFMYIHKPLLPKAEKVLIDYVNQGGKMIVLHHGLASAKLKNPVWLAMAGMTIPPRDHPQTPWRVTYDTTHTLVNLNPGHFITTNQINYEKTVRLPDSEIERPAFDLKGTEIFLNQQHTDSTEKVILFGVAIQKGNLTQIQPTEGWYKRRGKGLLFYFQAGHEASDFQNSNYAQVLLNALEWQP